MKQHRPATRAPHGSPKYTERIAASVTSSQKRKFHRRGGSGWLRKLIDSADLKDEALALLGDMLSACDAGLSVEWIGRARAIRKKADKLDEES